MKKENSTNSINKNYLNENCGMFFTLSLIGGRWKISILAVLLDNGSMRYGELKRKIPGITERMFIAQLKELESDGLITKTVYSIKYPHVEYQLSECGLSLRNILDQMNEWGEKNKNHPNL
ncbi:winged helix-turn-helix transcriptional regulator [Dysgonomonas sp. HGC4]|uniref:winged helix-turn-helix transcriptional regulator n=1 Tax=Dysgonomonas sp. HGC4 TaxID=1658009 RepID=UPI0006822069|nr:helix-turn-helix domain-containing protein [Dysgonomonas sp. HGC4]MBD8349867.1 helix-turn-helix transcriptional regulator [Dysgonomonas sp. HGC4]